MPKIEKKLQKDLTSLQQEIKRKPQDPGTPSDYGIWEGALDSKSRQPALSNILPKYGFSFGYISSITNTLPRYAFSFMHGVAILVESFHLLFRKEIITFMDITFKNMKHLLKDSITLEDEVTTQLN